MCRDVLQFVNTIQTDYDVCRSRHGLTSRERSPKQEYGKHDHAKFSVCSRKWNMEVITKDPMR